MSVASLGQSMYCKYVEIYPRSLFRIAQKKKKKKKRVVSLATLLGVLPQASVFRLCCDVSREECRTVLNWKLC